MAAAGVVRLVPGMGLGLELGMGMGEVDEEEMRVIV